MPATASAGQSSKTDRRDSPTRMMVLWSVVLTLAVAVFAALLTWLVADGVTAVAVLVGAVLSLGVFAVGLIAIRGILAGPNQAAMAGAFLVLILQLAITGGAFVLAGAWDFLQVNVMGVAFIAAGLVFQVGAVAGYLKSRVTVMDTREPVKTAAGVDG